MYVKTLRQCLAYIKSYVSISYYYSNLSVEKKVCVFQSKSGFWLQTKNSSSTMAFVNIYKLSIVPMLS